MISDTAPAVAIQIMSRSAIDRHHKAQWPAASASTSNSNIVDDVLNLFGVWLHSRNQEPPHPLQSTKANSHGTRLKHIPLLPCMPIDTTRDFDTSFKCVGLSKWDIAPHGRDTSVVPGGCSSSAHFIGTTVRGAPFDVCDQYRHPKHQWLT